MMSVCQESQITYIGLTSSYETDVHILSEFYKLRSLNLPKYYFCCDEKMSQKYFSFFFMRITKFTISTNYVYQLDNDDSLIDKE